MGTTASAPPSTAPVGWEQAYAQAVEAYERAAYVDSSRLARLAHSTAATTLGPDTTEAGAALSLLAAAELALGRYPEATAAFEESLTTLRRTPDADPKDMAAAMGNLGELHRQQGQLDRALPWYEQAYRTNELAYGPAHGETATALAALALARHESGLLPEAEQAYAQALTLMADAGAPKLQLAKVRTNLADLLIHTDRTDEAGLMLEGVLATEQALLRPGHPDLAYTLNTLGTLADAQGRDDDALEFYRYALDIRRDALPPGHPAIATVLANMGGAYHDLGAVAEARDSYAQALNILREAHDDEHPDIASLEAAMRALD
ncbi:tetratricopeptide repeat protein [Luteimonas terricola]|nr:tetratricopeptide repeat protein [Luteimonas terricola]